MPHLGPTNTRPMLADEVVIFRIRQSIVLLGFQLLVLAVVAGILTLILRQIGLGDNRPVLGPMTVNQLAMGLGLAAPALVGLVRLIEYLTTTYTLTNRRVQSDFGIFRRTSYAIPLAQIETLDINRSVIGRIFGYGDVVARPTAAVPIVITFRTIALPDLRREQIEEQLP